MIVDMIRGAVNRKERVDEPAHYNKNGSVIMKRVYYNREVR